MQAALANTSVRRNIIGSNIRFQMQTTKMSLYYSVALLSRGGARTAGGAYPLQGLWTPALVTSAAMGAWVALRIHAFMFPMFRCVYFHLGMRRSA